MIGLRKAQSLIGRIIEMEESGEYCIDIMQQNLAAIGLLKAAHQNLMEGHLKSCFKNAMASASENKKHQMIEEILKVSKVAGK